MKKEKTILIISIITLLVIISILTIHTLNKPPVGELKEITYENITTKIKNKDDFILIVSQSTCSHCATYKPKVEKIAQEYGIIVYYIDYDKLSNKEIFLKELHLTGATPITLFFEEGKEKSILNRIEGDLSNKTIIEKFKQMGFINE